MSGGALASVRRAPDRPWTRSSARAVATTSGYLARQRERTAPAAPARAGGQVSRHSLGDRTPGAMTWPSRHVRVEAAAKLLLRPVLRQGDRRGRLAARAPSAHRAAPRRAGRPLRNPTLTTRSICGSSTATEPLVYAIAASIAVVTSRRARYLASLAIAIWAAHLGRHRQVLGRSWTRPVASPGTGV